MCSDVCGVRLNFAKMTAFGNLLVAILCAPMQQPPILRSDVINLKVGVGRVNGESFAFNGRMYNGNTPGPTLVVTAGNDFTII